MTQGDAFPAHPMMHKRIPLVLLLAGTSWQWAFAYGAKDEGAIPAPAIAGHVQDLNRSNRANFRQERTSVDAQRVADWIVDSGDNQQLPFMVIDKVDARVYLFHADGQLQAASAVLLGLAVGDESVADIGERKLSDIRSEERTTPAGRFVASLGRNLHGGQILWVDYASALSLHPVITNNPKEHRAQRLSTPTPHDNRISFGCINVPNDFFERAVKPAFASSNGIVYVLPETRPLRKVFPSFDDKIIP